MAGRIPRVVIIGPTYIDMSVRCDTFPQPGSSIEGTGFSCLPTGPGPNRAVEAALCDCEVSLITKVGDDPFGGSVIRTLAEKGVNTELVMTAQAMCTGVNVTVVDSLGENTTISCEGANRALSPDELACAEVERVIGDSDVCMIHGGLGRETVNMAIKTAKMCGTRVILETNLCVLDTNSGYALNCPSEYYLVDVLVPNFVGAGETAEIGAGAVHKLKMVGSELVAGGIECVIIKMGSKGTFIIDRRDSLHLPGICVDRVDRSGCADAFGGAFAAACGAGDTLRNAVKFAAAAGALSCTKFGSLEAMPTKEEILELLLNQPD